MHYRLNFGSSTIGQYLSNSLKVRDFIEDIPARIKNIGPETKNKISYRLVASAPVYTLAGAIAGSTTQSPLYVWLGAAAMAIQIIAADLILS